MCCPGRRRLLRGSRLARRARAARRGLGGVGGAVHFRLAPRPPRRPRWCLAGVGGTAFPVRHLLRRRGGGLRSASASPKGRPATPATRHTPGQRPGAGSRTAAPGAVKSHGPEARATERRSARRNGARPPVQQPRRAARAPTSRTPPPRIPAVCAPAARRTGAPVRRAQARGGAHGSVSHTHMAATVRRRGAVCACAPPDRPRGAARPLSRSRPASAPRALRGSVLPVQATFHFPAVRRELARTNPSPSTFSVPPCGRPGSGLGEHPRIPWVLAYRGYSHIP